MLCERCNDGVTKATTHQEHRHPTDPEHWGTTGTDRCDDCAQALRDYVRLPQITMEIVVDRPLVSPAAE